MSAEGSTHINEAQAERNADKNVVKARNARRALKAGGLADFMAYVQSPWRIIWSNFLVGVFRGLGLAIGATLVLGTLLWLLALARHIPMVGEFASDLKDQIVQYAEETRYSDDFERIEAILVNIEQDLQRQNKAAQ
jgi:hypothetical protein